MLYHALRIKTQEPDWLACISMIGVAFSTMICTTRRPAVMHERISVVKFLGSQQGESELKMLLESTPPNIH